jgi:predicted DNA-binding transcriptional regulator YafY
MARKKLKHYPKRYCQAARVIDIARQLSTYRTGLTVREMMEHYGVTRRTICRDLAAMQEAGLLLTDSPAPPARSNNGNERVWKLLPGDPVRNVFGGGA